MTDKEIVPHSETWTKVKKIEEAGTMALKGYNYSEISEVMDISPALAKNYIDEYRAILMDQSERDPYFLERIGFNTIKSLKEFDEIGKEAWETVEIATTNGMVGARVQALKLAMEVADKKARLHQLMSTSKADNDYIARTQRAETVNQIISKVIRDIVSECPNCRDKARVQLREAFAMMEEEGFDGPEEAAEHLDFQDAEVVESDPE